MNKIININLAGRLIPIDEAAYGELSSYLSGLKKYFAKERGGDEIVRDMEDRIGEIFQQKLKGGAPCIMQEDVHSMVGIMGSPQEIASEAEDTFTGTARAQQQETASGMTQPGYINNEKKFARSSQDKVIGGVCGGAAAYFNIDPAIVRVIFALLCIPWGSGILLYIILWAVLPEAEGISIQTPRKRLFRNPDQKVIGGVCSGIAAYFKTEIYLIRLLFVAPLLASIFMGVFGSDIISNFVAAGMPVMFLLYIILWISVPKAETLAQKLEMRGENVDVQTLSNSLASGPKAAQGKPGVPVRKNSSEAGGVLLKIIAFFFLGVALITLTGIIVSILAALFGITSAGFAFYHYKDLVTPSSALQWIIWISALLIFLIPAYAIIKLMVRIISGRRNPSTKWLNISLALLWVGGFLALAASSGAIVNDFRTNYKAKETFALTQPVNDTLIIRQAVDDNVVVSDWGETDNWISREGDSSFAIRSLRMNIVNSPDSLFHVVLFRSAHGADMSAARALANKIHYSVTQSGNVLTIPNHISIPKGNPFRAQEVTVQVQVPVGKTFKTEEIDDDVYNRIKIVVGTSGRKKGFVVNEEGSYKKWSDNEYHKMILDTLSGNQQDQEEVYDDEY